MFGLELLNRGDSVRFPMLLKTVHGNQCVVDRLIWTYRRFVVLAEVNMEPSVFERPVFYLNKLKVSQKAQFSNFYMTR